jgi:Na+/H+ antiporter NhaC
MSFEQIFSLASTAALIGWACLILLPRHRMVMQGLRYGLIGSLSTTYAVLIMLYFFRIEGGGFNSITEVRALFLSDPGLLAGWIHYLAFDLFVGMWIAEEADKSRVARLLQAPILLATFMFGPLGLLLFLGTRLIQPQPILEAGA